MRHLHGIGVAGTFARTLPPDPWRDDKDRQLRAWRDDPPGALDSIRPHLRHQPRNAAALLLEQEASKRLDGDSPGEPSRLRTAPQRRLRRGNEQVVVPESDMSSLPPAGCGGTLACAATIVPFDGPADVPHAADVHGNPREPGRRPVRVPGLFEYGYEPLESFDDDRR